MKTSFSADTHIRVRYSETDQMGYCYYGNYAHFFEVGRVEALRTLGLNYKDLEDEGYMLPVVDLSVHYKRPSFYDDLLTVTTHIREVKGPRIVFDYTVLREEGETVCTGVTTLVFVSKETMRPVQPPSHFIELIALHQIKD